jgi:hypothetical protein
LNLTSFILPKAVLSWEAVMWPFAAGDKMI